MMVLTGGELEKLVFKPDIFLFFYYHRSTCIIDNGASKRRTQNTHFRARRADHLH